MDYPLMIAGQRAGTLRVWQEGLYTYMEASTDRQGGILRLWVQGGGQEQYLGLMQPGKEGMSLLRRLTKREMSGFPSKIELATDRPGAETAGDRIWERLSDGSLICRDEGLAALPAVIKGKAYGADLRIICGRQYLVFKY
jgi:hypothetical protein